MNFVIYYLDNKPFRNGFWDIVKRMTGCVGRCEVDAVGARFSKNQSKAVGLQKLTKSRKILNDVLTNLTSWRIADVELIAVLSLLTAETAAGTFACATDSAFFVETAAGSFALPPPAIILCDNLDDRMDL
uniref:Uncharacterized protein n=1 Tax=Romanomermis culicivorax TaxID=13658 RepID=A0A915JF99_ROMCU